MSSSIPGEGRFSPDHCSEPAHINVTKCCIKLPSASPPHKRSTWLVANRLACSGCDSRRRNRTEYRQTRQSFPPKRYLTPSPSKAGNNVSKDRSVGVRSGKEAFSLQFYVILSCTTLSIVPNVIWWKRETFHKPRGGRQREEQRFIVTVFSFTGPIAFAILRILEREWVHSKSCSDASWKEIVLFY